MNIVKAFSEYLEDNGHGTFGTDLFIGGVPLDAPEASYWILSSGGINFIKAQTNEKMKRYTINVFYRDSDAENVYENLQDLEELINADENTQLNGFDTVEMEATQFPADQDLDSEDRTVGMLEVVLTTYYS